MRGGVSGGPGHGLAFGDWYAVLRQVTTDKVFRAVGEQEMLYEVRTFLQDAETEVALRSLLRLRNDLAHRRGPKREPLSRAARARSMSQASCSEAGSDYLSPRP